jgi:hypothetical protein
MRENLRPGLHLGMIEKMSRFKTQQIQTYGARLVFIFSVFALLSGAAAAAVNLPPLVTETCVESVSYTCANGYYGTPTNGSSGCTACPEHASCDGTGNTIFSCNMGYYKSGSGCAPCPDGGMTATGGQAIDNCYLPAGSSFDDDSGTFQMTNRCYYSK